MIVDLVSRDDVATHCTFAWPNEASCGHGDQSHSVSLSEADRLLGDRKKQARSKVSEKNGHDQVMSMLVTSAEVTLRTDRQQLLEDFLHNKSN